MKPRVARVSLIFAIILFITGFGVLCACPGWYAIAALCAANAAWVGTGRTRKWASIWLVASLILTVLETIGLIQEHRDYIEKAQRIRQMRTHGTNTLEPTNAPAN